MYASVTISPPWTSSWGSSPACRIMPRPCPASEDQYPRVLLLSETTQETEGKGARHGCLLHFQTFRLQWKARPFSFYSPSDKKLNICSHVSTVPPRSSVTMNLSNLSGESDTLHVQPVASKRGTSFRCNPRPRWARHQGAILYSSSQFYIMSALHRKLYHTSLTQPPLTHNIEPGQVHPKWASCTAWFQIPGPGHGEKGDKYT